MNRSDKRHQVIQLIDSIRALFHLLGAVGTAAHSDLAITASMRGVMESLSRKGPNTVSRMARARSVSRQHIQRIVDDLRDRGLARLEPNPDHQRSPIVALTDLGVRSFESMMRTEMGLIDRIAAPLDLTEIDTAVSALGHFRSALNQVAAKQGPVRSRRRASER